MTICVYIPKVLLEGNGKTFYIFGSNMCATFQKHFRMKWKEKKTVYNELRERKESKAENWKENLCLLLKHGVDIIFVSQQGFRWIESIDIEIKLNEPSKCFVKTKPILLKRRAFLRSTHFKTHTHLYRVAMCRQCVRWILASSGDTRTQKFNEIQRVLLLARILCVWQKFIIHTNHAW